MTTDTAIKERMNIVIVGHVDHGKSTLLGRLYADTGTLPIGKIEKIQAICKQQGKEFEYAFLFDSFLEEQQQGITIDTARTFFSWGGRQYIIIDAPGHKEFLKNMVSGAARAEAALLVIDALEGVRDQSKRHGLLLSMLGVKQVTVIVNKMDLVGYRQDTFQAIEKEYRDFLSQLNVTPQYVIPASAKLGVNIAQVSPETPWYTGPSVLDSLAHFSLETALAEKPLRLPIQDVYKFDARRILVGRITAGQLKIGDRLVFSPSNKSANIQTIEAFNVDPPPTQAQAGQSVGITLDEQIFVERGQIAAQETDRPLVSTRIRANLFWLGKQPLETRRTYSLRLATREVPCEIAKIHRIVDANNLDDKHTQSTVKRNEVADITLRTKTPIAFDLYANFETTGRFVLVDDYDVAGGGIITELVHDEQESFRTEARERDSVWVKGDITPADRAKQYGHHAAVLLFTGPDTTAKAFLARKLETVLVAERRHAYLLSPENLQRGLDADLQDTKPEEVIRRFGEVIRLLTDTGLLVLCTTNAFQQPTRELIPTIQTLVNPTPLITIHMAKELTGPQPDTDLTFAGPENFDDCTSQIIQLLKSRGLLKEFSGGPSEVQFSI
ncbi:MAG: adenylyl-sulfate kinase [Nitrospira sp.]|nr:adenylyl-sulfate kinase [Nitrospira sp.]MCA9481320.1 adenylyl-sulfate kinase [Nitrospira sp.]MCB9711715.1 adenylyl-sulfate kinase [Nitrospiraceae bacterium]MCB9776902.1 adenylyl-sulfate kinase [Nitrospiraceae bacterium]MDR4488699.1 GTP-binding protein [Nitrospirales bacterium]